MEKLTGRAQAVLDPELVLLSMLGPLGTQTPGIPARNLRHVMACCILPFGSLQHAGYPLASITKVIWVGYWPP